MDEVVIRALQLIEASEAAQQVRDEELWNLLLESYAFGLRELIEEVGIDLSEARQVLTDARVGDSPALLLIVLGRREEVREALLRMRHGHY
jgi:hypothetical protein